eukprot:TRINITY_DN63365_c0_g1_i3.p1 TRINITY_DN63365_c0_g1~~TRINITY_DN63365_c0_g1_i3.p1  ORF type:complete len:149 (+),score=9.29 TRINITY_DN63365_c0_g1_i3:201-647(+)
MAAASAWSADPNQVAAGGSAVENSAQPVAPAAHEVPFPVFVLPLKSPQRKLLLLSRDQSPELRALLQEVTASLSSASGPVLLSSTGRRLSQRSRTWLRDQGLCLSAVLCCYTADFTFTGSSAGVYVTYLHDNVDGDLVPLTRANRQKY